MSRRIGVSAYRRMSVWAFAALPHRARYRYRSLTGAVKIGGGEGEAPSQQGLPAFIESVA